MICGSLPPGVPADFYCELIDLARMSGVHSLLDTDGEALLHGLEAGPTVVTPNQHEAERLLNRALLTRSQFLEAVSASRPWARVRDPLTRQAAAWSPATATKYWKRYRPGSTRSARSAPGMRWPPPSYGRCRRSVPSPMPFAGEWLRARASAAQPGMNFATPAQTKETYRQVSVRSAR